MELNIQHKIISSNNLVAKQNSKSLNLISEGDDNSKISNELQQLAEIGKSQINFRGKFFQLNQRDLMFLNGLVAVFGLSAVTFDKLKMALTEYLQENKFSSMEDFAGDEHIDEQANLTEKLNDILKLDGDDYNILNYRIIERCDAEEDYIPGEYDEMMISLDKSMTNIGQTIRDIETKNDKKMLDAFVEAFALDSEEAIRLNEIVQDVLDENDLVMLRELNELGYVEVQAAMLEQIRNEFALPEDAIEAMLSEFMNRFLLQGADYTPHITSLDLNQELLMTDKTILNDIFKKYNLSPKNSENLHYAMKIDTLNNGLESVFELFDKDNNAKYPETLKVLNSDEFIDIKDDLMIDFHVAVKNKEKILDKIEDDNKEQVDYTLKISAMISALNSLHDFSKEEIEQFQKYFEANKLDFNDKKQLWKSAYEYIEQSGINDIKESDFVQKAEEINNCSPDELMGYHFAYLKIFKNKFLKYKQ